MPDSDRILILRVPEGAVVSVTRFMGPPSLDEDGQPIPGTGKCLLSSVRHHRPSDQRLTVGDVLSVCEGADGSAAQHLHDADHQGPSKAEHYRRIASEYSEAAKKLRAAVSDG